MRIIGASVFVCAVALNGCVGAPPASAPQPTNTSRAIPLILEKDEGERRTWRGWPGHPKPGETFVLKVDPENGASSHLVFGTETEEPGDAIGTHEHPHADEILFLQTGTSRVHVGNMVRVVHSGATVFIPAGTWVSLTNIGHDAVHLAFIFSAPGFEQFMRAESVRPGEKNTHVFKAEDEEIQKRLDVVIYK
jgi:quercetin dioxygenase-like cupin family protein